MRETKRLLLFTSLLAGASAAFHPAANADLLRYADTEGRTHYVDSVEKVPQEYRSQLTGETEIPNISRGGKANYHERIRRPANFPSPGSRKNNDPGAPPPMLGKDPLEIFVTSDCPYCKMLEAFLLQHHISYTKYDIAKDAKAKKRYEELGGGALPTVKLGDRVFHGFDVGAFQKLIDNRQLPPKPQPERHRPVKGEQPPDGEE